MKYVYLSILIFVFLISTVSAWEDEEWDWNDYDNNDNSCRTSYQIRPGNQINMQIPHFWCCDCEGDGCGVKCKMGDQYSEHLTLTNVQDCEEECQGYGEADINAFNYDGRDRTKITLRLSDLKYNEVYTVWLISEYGSLYLGEFKTNSVGRGFFVHKMQFEDFTVYDKLVIKHGNKWIFRDFLNPCNND